MFETIVWRNDQADDPGGTFDVPLPEVPAIGAFCMFCLNASPLPDGSAFATEAELVGAISF